ncbi:MAG: hypothetical protein EXR28_09845 [Betaproteobacteria bacterium]|nr:hypothetical protein [Betaproteobacteria bacterium]
MGKNYRQLSIEERTMIQTQVLSREDARFDEVVDYLRQVTKHHGMPADFPIEGAEAVIWR